MIRVALGAFFILCALGAGLAFLTSEERNPRLLATVGALASAALCAAGAAALWGPGLSVELWPLPPGHPLRIGVDALSGLFLAITGLVCLPVSIYCAGYLRRSLGEHSLRAFTVLHLSLLAAIVCVLIARDVLSFLLAWELMSIVSYLLVNYEHQRDENIRAGYLMLAMGEAGTLAVALAWLVLARDVPPPAHGWDFASLKAAGASLASGARWAVFLLSFLGFGVKAGLVPVNSWLPRAHPVAPANVSALLSGVILNLGIYGIVRINVDLLPATLVGTGLLALILGAITAFVGILYATTSNDTKSLLAHSSIENMGLIITALGAGFVFTATRHPALAGIAFVAALYHLANHSVYKALLFLGAGAVDVHAGTRDLDRLGGLIHRMPWTALFFLAGALSISAIYPFGGFASEWLTLQALLRSAELPSAAVKSVFALCGVGLALTAALAITCFVKAFGMGFLGMPRSPAAERAREAPVSMLAPMGALACLSLLLGITPTFVIGALSRALPADAQATQALVPAFFAHDPEHTRLSPAFVGEFHDLGAQLGQDVVPGRGLVVLHQGGADNPVVFAMSTSYGIGVLLALLAVTAAVLWGVTRRRRVARQAPWDGGVRQLLPEMTYTATGFSNPVRVIFDAILRPRTLDTEETVAEHFRVAIIRSRQQTHLVDRLVLNVLTRWMMGTAGWLARMHHGRVNAYVAYVLGTLVLFLVVAALP